MTAQSGHARLQSQVWEQLLKLLSGQPWSFQSEHWPSLEKLIGWHHIALSCYRELSAHRHRHDFSNDQMETLHQTVLAERKHLLVLTRLQRQIQQQLQDEGIRALFFKGLVAGQWLYGSNLARQCRDIDLIVHPNDHAAACQALTKIDCYQLIPGEHISDFGMARYRAAMKDFSLVHRPSNGLIELHWALRPFKQAFSFDFDQAWDTRISVEIDGNPVASFSDSLHIRYLAAHGCNSHWGRLCWLLDWQKISQLELDWEQVIADCANRREQSHLKNAFRLCQKQFGSEIPEAINALPEARFSSYSIQAQAQSQMQGRYPGWAQRQLLNLACQQDLPGALGYLAYMGKKALAADTLQP